MRASRFRSRTLRSLRAILLPLATLTLVTCGEDPAGPSRNQAAIRIRPIFSPYARVAPLVIDRVAIFVFRFVPPESSEIVYRDTVNFSVNRNSLTLDGIRVDMEEATEDVQVEIELLAGNTLLFSGLTDVTLIRGGTVRNVDVDLNYTGPGSNVARLQIAPLDTVVRPGATVDFTLDAFDIQGADVPDYYAGWSLSSGAASSAKINAIGHLTASSANDTFFVVVATPNGVLDSARVIVSSGGTAPATTLIWNGSVSTDFSTAANWTPAQIPSFGDSVVIGATPSQRQPSLTAQVVVAAINITDGGVLTVAGQGISSIRGLTTGGSGVLVMTNPEDVVVIQGDALFDGGDELDLMSEGALGVGGNLTQRATNSGDSFHPSANHVTLLNGANPTLSFATPGLVPGTSHFQRLAWIGTGTLNLASQVMAHEDFLIVAQGASIIASTNGSRLTVGQFGAIGPVAMNGVPLTMSTTGTPTGLTDVTFQNMPTTVSQLVVSHPGAFFTFTNVVFSTTPVAPNGFYLEAIDNSGPTDGIVVVDMVNPTPTTGGSFVKATGGAVVNWPSGAAATVRVWSGATSTNWATAANWVGGVVPGATDSAMIVAATNAPSVLNSATVGAVNVASGTLTIGDASLTVARGFATTGTGTLAMQSGAGLDVGGSVSFGGGSTAGLLDNGIITVGGNFTQTSGTSTQSFAAGSNHTVTLNNTLATVGFASPGATASHFGTLEQGNTATGFTFTSNVVVTGSLDGPDGFGGEIFGSNVSLTLAQSTGCCVDLNGVVLIIDDPTGTFNGVNGVTFTNVPTTATQLTIRSPGSAQGFNVSNVNWRTLSAGNTGSYLDITDINGATGGTLAVTVSSNDPGNGPTFTKTGGGALAFWPGSQVSWTGAVSTDWGDPRNWNALRVPFQNNLLIPAGTPNAPVVSSTLIPAVGDLTVASGQTISIQDGGTLRSIGNVTATGNVTTAGTGVLSLEGTGKTVTGNLGETVVQNGPITLSGNVNTAVGTNVTVAGTLALGGHTLKTEVLTVNTTAGLLVMTNPNDSLLTTTGAVFQGADETGQLTAGVITTGGGITVAATTANQFAASGTHKVVINGARNAGLSFPNGTSSHFQNLEIATVGNFQAQLISSTVTVAGNLSVLNGQMATSGRRLNVGGNFSTSGAGILTMTSAGDSLVVSGNASFSGGSTSGILTNGVLRVIGDFTQSAVNSVTSFAPSGLHKTVLGGAAASDVSMGSPGAGAAGSHFQVLDVTPATGGIILDVNMQADSLISTAAAARIEGPLVALTARRVQVTGLTFFNTRFILDEQGGFAPETFSNVTFTGYPANSTGLVLFTFIGPGGAAAARPAPVTTNVNFTPQLGVGAANFYVDLTSSNGFQVNLTMTGSNQGAAQGGNGTALTRVNPPTGVATVAWP